MTQAGKLRHRIVIQRPVEVQSASGEVTRTWEDWRTVWASITPTRVAKEFGADQIVPVGDVTIRLRYRTGYRAEQRVIHEKEDGIFQVFDVIGVVEINERRRDIELVCKLREADGDRNAKL